MLVDPLRKDDCPPITDGAAAVVLAAGRPRPRRTASGPAWIRGIDHRIESARARRARPHRLAVDPRRRRSEAGVGDGTVDVAELHAPFSHQELILREALGLGDDVDVNPSGGALVRQPDHGGRAHPHRRGRRSGSSTGAPTARVAHATSGPCLQQNLVCVLEGDS